METKTILYNTKCKTTMLPRERLSAYGVDVLSDTDLISVILGSGIQGASVHDIAKKVMCLLDTSNNVLNLEDLLTIKGLGKAKALAILSILELGRRVFVPRKRKIISPDDMLPLLTHYADREQECFFTFSLNGASEIIAQEIISVGLLNKTLVHSREIFRQAIVHRAAKIIMAHNHPSGNVIPSVEDITITKKLVQVGDLLDIQVLDHIIFSSSDHFSFLNHNLM